MSNNNHRQYMTFCVPYTPTSPEDEVQRERGVGGGCGERCKPKQTAHHTQGREVGRGSMGDRGTSEPKQAIIPRGRGVGRGSGVCVCGGGEQANLNSPSYPGGGGWGGAVGWVGGGGGGGGDTSKPKEPIIPRGRGVGRGSRETLVGWGWGGGAEEKPANLNKQPVTPQPPAEQASSQQTWSDPASSSADSTPSVRVARVCRSWHCPARTSTIDCVLILASSASHPSPLPPNTLTHPLAACRFPLP